MLISEVQLALEAVKAESGDLPVVIDWERWPYQVETFEVEMMPAEHLVGQYDIAEREKAESLPDVLVVKIS